jgi:hypothetical protein
MTTLNKNEEFLADIPLPEIAEVFASFGSEEEARVTIIPIGFPAAGKSLFLSSLLHYAKSSKREKLFNITPEPPKGIFLKGRIAFNEMVEYFHNGQLYGANAKGSIDLIGLDIKPNNEKLSKLKIAFLDLAGEDIQNIKVSNNAEFTGKIKAVLNGLQANDAPVIFTLITPFEPAGSTSFGSNSVAHDREDTLHFDFLSFLEKEEPNIFKNSKIFIIVSQWDKNTNPQLNIENYIQKYRPSIYAFVKNLNVIWGSYSVGRLLVQQDETGKSYQKLITINEDYPENFWKKLYQVCTGDDLDQKTFWQKLFGFFK